MNVMPLPAVGHTCTDVSAFASVATASSILTTTTKGTFFSLVAVALPFLTALVVVTLLLHLLYLACVFSILAIMQRRDAAGLQSCCGNVAMEQQQQHLQEDEQQSRVAPAPTVSALVSVPTPVAHALTATAPAPLQTPATVPAPLQAPATVPAPLQAPAHERHQKIVAPCQSSVAKPYKLSSTDKAAIKSYSTHGYQAINGQMRGLVEETKKIQKVIQTLLQLLKHPTALDVFVGKVYRGTGVPANVFDALQPGSMYTEASFLSTSKELVQATCFVPLRENGVTCHRPTAMFTIYSQTGRHISPHCKGHEHEAEVLFRPSALFMVKEVVVTRKKEGNLHKDVIMEEIVV
jgi:ADP-ribosyltransferase exoenzyme